MKETIDKHVRHTPGPWISQHNGHALVILTMDRSAVAEVFAIRDTRDTATPNANARLIAASPDLLESLRQSVAAMERMDAMLLRLTNSPFECEKGEITRARLAISKAEGREALTRG